MKTKNPVSPKSSRKANLPRRFFRARKAAAFAARAWPLWLALASAASLFFALQRPVAARHRLHRQIAALPADRQWVEMAVAAYAATHHLEPGALIPADHWRLHLPPQAPAALRTHGLDPLGQPYGPQRADGQVGGDR